MTRAGFPILARWLFAAGLLCVGPQPGRADDHLVRIGGTGMALAALEQIGASLMAADPAIRVKVLPSMGTSGGLKAVRERAIEVAVAARPLTSDEKSTGISEAACMTTAVVFASSHKAATGLTKARLPAIYADPSPKWPDGMPLRVILRSRAGSENSYLAAEIPGLAMVLEQAYKRPGMPVGSSDQDNVKLALQVAGSLAVTTLLQIRAEQLDLAALPLDGVAASAETLANKTYPLPIRVCIVVLNGPSPAAARFVAHFRSAAGRAIVESLGAAPAD